MWTDMGWHANPSSGAPWPPRLSRKPSLGMPQRNKKKTRLKTVAQRCYSVWPLLCGRGGDSRVDTAQLRNNGVLAKSPALKGAAFPPHDHRPASRVPAEGSTGRIAGHTHLHRASRPHPWSCGARSLRMGLWKLQRWLYSPAAKPAVCGVQLALAQGACFAVFSADVVKRKLGAVGGNLVLALIVRLRLAACGLRCPARPPAARAAAPRGSHAPRPPLPLSPCSSSPTCCPSAPAAARSSRCCS